MSRSSHLAPRMPWGFLAVVVLGASSSAAPALGAGLDWQVRENPQPGPAIRVVRNVRDGVVGFGDAFVEGNTALFGEFALGLAKLTMGLSDVVGLLDDNPFSQHVSRAFFSKQLAKTSYFWHVAGAESLLGGHGLEVERWAIPEAASLNPLLDQGDVAALEGPLPLDPLDFVGDGFFHLRVYRTHFLLFGVGAIAVDDGLLRPLGAMLRLVQFPEAGKALEDVGNRLFRRTTRFQW